MAVARRRRGWKAIVASTWSAALVAVLATGLVIAAAVVPGFKISDLHLHEGAVFAVKGDTRLVGLLNTQIDGLATSIRSADQSFDVLQSETRVLLKASSNQLQELDFARGVPGAPVQLPSAASVALGGDTLAIVNPTDGRMWTGDVASILAIDFAQAPAQIDLGEGGIATVTTSGIAIGLSLRDQQVVRVVGGRPVITKLPWQISTPYDVQLSAVGDKAVVLDRGSRQVWIEGDANPIQIEGGSGSAQLAAPAAGPVQAHEEARAVFANSSGLVGIANNRLISLVSGINGQPGVPVVVGDCAYGVFTNGRFAKFCSGGEPITEDIPQFPGDDELKFRVNRGVVVLNASRLGYIWLVDKGMKLITDWTRVTPPEAQQGERENPEETQTIPPNRDQVNRPPVAGDDLKMQARAGRSTMLTLLDNDSDPDGDILTILPPAKPNQGSLALVRGGTGIQLTLPPDAKGTVTFSYTVSDGRGLSDSANVVVRVLPQHQSSANTAPVQRKRDPLVVALGSSMTKRALLDWRDPDGDDLVLLGATMVDGDDEVDFTPAGIINYRDVGTKPGRKEIEVTVSDGLSETKGIVIVDARKGRDIQPVANGDYYSTTVNQEIVLRPLENDVGQNLKLARVTRERTTNFAADPNYQENTIRFSAKQAGVYYIRYVVTNGYGATGLIRVDVIAPTPQNRAPVAARDVAMLPEGSVLVDPLANDEDADGDVLVLQSVSSDPHLKISMEQRRLLRITAISRPTEPINLTYRVSDGINAVEGTIIVIPAPAGAKTTPVGVSDEVTVRAGDTTTVNVLRNDYSPIGLDLKVDSKLVESPGVAWVDGETVRFTAPNTAGQYRAVYRIVDSRGQEASARILFNVVASDVENQAPKPELVEGRVLANSITKIPVQLQGIDPNGDSVRLLGLNTGPTRGRVVSVGERWIEYQSYSSTGTDSFQYQVTDSRGAIGIGTIRVGIVPRENDVNTPPVAGDDEIRSRPGRPVRLGVLANDSDPDGEPISLREDLDFPFPVEIKDRTDLVFKIPEQPGTYSGQYTVVDFRGRSSQGVVTIISDPDAPLLPPVVRDDQVLANQVVGKSVVDVPVLNNDYDPDGDSSQLKLSIPGGNTENVSVPTDTDEPVVRVRIGRTMQLVRYEVTDADGQKNWAVIVVPGAADSVPVTKADITPLKVIAGETLSIPIGDYVVGTEGRPVSLTSEDRIWATNGHGKGAGPRTVEFDAREDYVGPASIVFEVTDGRSNTDESGKRAVISLPIEITPRPKSGNQNQNPNEHNLNRPPTVAGVITIDVGAGEPPRTVDLSQYVSDLDGDPTGFDTFSGNAPLGVQVSFSRDWASVTASAEITAAPGGKGSYTGLVKDGRGGETPVRVEFVVVASTRPRPTVVNDEVPNADQGRPSTVQVLDNDRSNLLTDQTLYLMGAEVVAGSGSARVEGRSVIVTPSPEFVGEMRVRYTVQDATKSASRQVDGYVTLTVRGKPSRPGVVVLGSIGNTQLNVNWTAATANGLPIQKYVVTASSSGHSTTQDCAATTCTITGLRNGNNYRLTVVAVNALGASEPSAPSAEMMPDVKPEAPPAPDLTPGDKQILAKWSVPKNDGTEILAYTLEITGDMSSIQVVKKGSSEFNNRTVRFTGLTNGAQYTVRVQAENQAGESGWGPGASEVPAAPPDPPTNVVGQDEGTSTLGKAAQISWQAPANNNGARVEAYHIYANGTPVGDTDGNTTSRLVHLPGNGEYTFTVVARNRIGAGRPSAPSDTVTVFGAPGKPTKVEVDPGDNTVTLTSVTASANGMAPDRYVMKLIKEGGSTVVQSNNVTIPYTYTGIEGGARYKFEVRACAKSKCSEAAESAYVTAYKAPSPPSLSFYQVEDEDEIQYSWSNSDSANGPGKVVLYLTDSNGRVGMTETLNMSGTRTTTVTGTRTILAEAVSKDTGLTSTAELTVRTPMTRPEVAADKMSFSFEVNHQSGSSMSCTVSVPTGPSVTVTVPLSGGSGTGTYTHPTSDPPTTLAGTYTITCGSKMKRTVTIG